MSTSIDHTFYKHAPKISKQVVNLVIYWLLNVQKQLYKH